MHIRTLFFAAAILGMLLPAGESLARTSGNARFGYDSQLLGASIDGKWVSCEDLQENDAYHLYRIWGGHAVSLYGSEGYRGEGVMGAIHADHPDEFANEIPGSYIYTVHTEAGAIGDDGPALLAVNFLDSERSWDPMPRSAKSLGTANPAYRSAVKDYLASAGLPDADPDIMQIFRVDLEGDGADEVLICAQNIVKGGCDFISWQPDKPLSSGTGTPGLAKAGSYSVVLLRKVSGNSVVTIPLDLTLITDVEKAETTVPCLHKIYCFADLNGDGVMEILTASDYYEGAFINVFEVKNTQVKAVLTGGFGV
ncbi:MAG: hypothetical protein J5855_07730 [Mailhella sp.]|nr:hypothetical protein [Mailhella sp.]